MVASKAKKQPGVMLYFDVRPALRRLSLEEKGSLFDAILEYGESGSPPSFDGVLGVAWDFIQPRLDRDRERYEEISDQRKEAANARWGKQRALQADANYAIASDAMQRMPTSTPTSTPTTSSTAAVAGGVGGDPERSLPLDGDAGAYYEDRRQEGI